MQKGLKVTFTLFLVFFSSAVSAAKFTDSNIELVGLSQASFSWGDYDKDGDLDMAVCGRNATGPQTIIYQNDKKILIQDTRQEIIGLSYGKIGWIDYDGDGDVDLSIAGYDSSVNPTAKIYTNVDGILTLDTEQHPAINYGSIDWADSDKDGKQDIYAHAGHDANWKPYTKVFKKKADGTYEEIKQNLISLYYGSVAWGDYTGDGKLDLLVTGWTPEGGIIKLYKDIDGSLIEDNEQKIEPVFHSSAVWGDYDLDGDVDLFIAGQGTNSVITKVYRNDNGILVEDTSQELPGVSFSALSLCDYDKDGDLDLVLAGALQDKTPITKLFLNDAATPLPIHHLNILLDGKIFKGGSFTTDNTLNLSSKGYDEKNNPITDLVVTWQIDNPVGNITKKDKGISLDLTKIGTSTLIAYDQQGHTATASLEVGVGALHTLQIEGEMPGIPINTSTVTPDMHLVFYARGYDADTNLRGEEVVNWSIIGEIGALSTTTATSVIFNPGKTGEGMIKIADENGHVDLTGTITVTPGITSVLKIEDVDGLEVHNLIVSADEDAYYLYARGYDSAGNYTGEAMVEWSITGEIGNLSITKGTKTLFNPHKPGTGTIKIEDTSGLVASTGLITVLVGKEERLMIVDNDNNPVNDITLTADDTLKLWAKTFDKQDNEIGLKEVNWRLNGDIGHLSTTTGTSVILDLVKVGTGTVVAETSLSDSTGIITVLPGKLHHFVFNPIDDQIVEVPFGITVTAKDQDENTVTHYNGTSNTFVDTTNTVDYGKPVNFIDGVLNNHQLTISKACESVIITTFGDEKYGESNKFAVLGGNISGEVKNELNEKLAGILIEAYLKVSNGTPTFKGSTTTFLDGSYLIAGLPPGIYEVRVIPPKTYQIPQPQIVEVEVILTKGKQLIMATNKVDFILMPAAKTTLKEAFVYPNPCVVSRDGAKMTFKGLTSKCTIKIFTLAGELVRSLEKNDTGDYREWDLKNDDGTRVASGIYIYLIQDNNTGETKTGKLGVIK